MIKYIGSKRLLVPWICSYVDALPGVRRVLDLFSGTARVATALKARGYHVTANDHNTYAYLLARCYVQADAGRVRHEVVRRLEELRRVAPSAGWFTETYSERSRYIRPENAARIEGVRERIASWHLDADVEAVLLVALMQAADRVDSTTGVQMAYLKQWAPRSRRTLDLRLPPLRRGPGRALQCEAWEAASLDADLAYLDPPYNRHSYLSNYHVWETLARWDRPDTFGIACKRLDCRTRKSPFNSRVQIHAALERVLDALRTRYVLLSFSDEGGISREDMEAMLAPRGALLVVEREHPRYMGARIGIYSPGGTKVGRVGRLANRERLYVLARDERDLDALRENRPLRARMAGQSPRD